ncbi:MAG: hypothetical protein WC712_04045 [Candidatus Brocadiia bacterium]
MENVSPKPEGEKKQDFVQIQLAGTIIPLSGRLLVGIGMLEDGKIKLLYAESIGNCEIVDGVPVNFPQFVESIKYGLSRAESGSKAELFSITAGLNGGGVVGLNSRGAIFLSDLKRSVTKRDIEKAVAAAGKIELSSDRTVLDIIPVSFSVDEARGLENPEGLEGNRLECEAHVITCRTDAKESLVKGVAKAGWKLEGIYYDGWGSAISGCAGDTTVATTLLIDVCDSHTDVMLLKHGRPRYTAIFPLGQKGIASELAKAVNVSVVSAKKLLAEHAAVGVSDGFTLESGVEVAVAADGGFPAKGISQGEIWTLTEKSYRPMLENIAKDLQIRNLIDGIDCVAWGGFAGSVRGLPELTRLYISGAARQLPMRTAGTFSDPLFNRLEGGLMYSFSRRKTSSPMMASAPQGIVNKIKDWFKDLI